MKTIKLLLILCLLASCSKQAQDAIMPASAITVISDLTDSLELYPTAEPVLSLYDFGNNPVQEASLRLVLLTDKKLNPVEDIHLESGSVSEKYNINDDVLYREQIIYSFQDAVRKAFMDFSKRYYCKPLSYSECYTTISSELGRLAASKASQRVLLIFSDLQENEEDYSCYKRQYQQMLQSNPAKVERLLQKRSPLPNNLVGVTVFFIYNPPDREHDSRYSAMVLLYQRLLRNRGARVVIQASNKKYEP